MLKFIFIALSLFFACNFLQILSKLSEEKCHLKEELEEATLKREQQEIKTDGKDMVMHYIVCILINKT